MAVRVLIAHGSARVRDAIRHHLECVGCEVVAEASTAAQALPLVRTVRPQLVTLGVQLRSGDRATPIGLLRLIKRELPRISVVMLASASPDRKMKAFLEEGVLGFVVEPFDSTSFSHLWQKLSAAFPELRARGAGAIITYAGPTSAKV